MKYLAILVFLTFALPSFASTFYIKQGGTATSKAAATGPCNIASACGDDSKINSWASKGDRVYICSDGGELKTPITGSGACNNGKCSSSDLITYQKSPDSAGVPDWDSNTPMIDIDGTISNYKEYMIFKELQHTNYNAKGWPINIDYAKNITLDNVDIIISPSNANYEGIAAVEYVQDIIVKNGTYSADGQTADTESEGFGFYYNAVEILIYNNRFGNATHNSLRFYNITPNGRIENIVIRGNIFENQWEHHYTLSLKDTTEADNGRILIEENIFQNGGQSDDSNPCTPDGGGCETDQLNYPRIGVHQVIQRGNVFAANDLDWGVYFAASSAETINDIKHYHNTHYDSKIPDSNTEGGYMFLFDGSENFKLTGLAIINNIFWKYNAKESNRDCQLYADNDNPSSDPDLVNDRVENNLMGRSNSPTESAHRWGKQDSKNTATCNAMIPAWSNNVDANPSFTNPAEKKFSLKNGSPAIDKSGRLTQVNDSGGGSGTSMVVDDATFFYGADWSIPGGGESGDFIYVDNQSSPDFIAQLSGVNYLTDTLRLTSSQKWDDNADVYWCPLRNASCFNGFAPDIGAIESEISQNSISSKKISAPLNFRKRK